MKIQDALAMEKQIGIENYAYLLHNLKGSPKMVN